MKNFICTFFCILVFNFHAHSQFVQTEFMIGAFWDPPYTTNTAATNQARLQDVVDANFNLLLGMNNGDAAAFAVPAANSSEGNGHTDELIYKLRMLAQYNQNSGRIALRTLVQDRVTRMIGDPWHRAIYSAALRDEMLNRYGPNAIISPAGSVPAPTYSIVSANGLGASVSAAEFLSLRNALMGYYVEDEPQPDAAPTTRPNDLTNTINWINGLSLADPGKLPFVNLFPRGGPFATQAIYETYVAQAFNAAQSRVIAYDNYPFVTDAAGNNIMDGNYYVNQQIFATQAQAQRLAEPGIRKHFWHYVHSIETPGNAFTEPSEINLRFMAKAPLIYGSKGVMYYTYSSLNPTEVATGEYGNALLNSGLTYTLTTNNPRPIYTWVQSINAEIRNLGPTLMELDWQATIHGSATDPISLEANLPTIADQSAGFIINSISSANDISNFAIGVLEHRGTKQAFLAILNKNRAASGSITISTNTSRGAFLFQALDQSNGNLFPVQNQTGKSFTVALREGDIQLVRLNRQMVPINSLLNE